MNSRNSAAYSDLKITTIFEAVSMSKTKKTAPAKLQLNSNGYDISNFIRVKFPTIKSTNSQITSASTKPAVSFKLK